MTFLRRFWEGWKRFGQAIGDFLARVILSIFYFAIFLPFGLGTRSRALSMILAFPIDMLASKVIALSQGRFEWGPRALGNRSIMADPRRAEMKNVVNERIKLREPFRPFAPVVLEEKAADFWEDLPEDLQQWRNKL